MTMIKFIKYIMNIISHVNFLDEIVYQLDLYKHKPLNSQITYTAIYLASFNSLQNDLNNIYEEVGL